MRAALWPAVAGLFLSLGGVAGSLARGFPPSAWWIALFLVSLVAIVFSLVARYLLLKRSDPQLARVVRNVVVWGPAVYQGGRAIHHISHHD